jgi:hypothetical protein
MSNSINTNTTNKHISPQNTEYTKWPTYFTFLGNYEHSLTLLLYYSLSFHSFQWYYKVFVSGSESGKNYIYRLLIHVFSLEIQLSRGEGWSCIDLISISRLKRSYVLAKNWGPISIWQDNFRLIQCWFCFLYIIVFFIKTNR